MRFLPNVNYFVDEDGFLHVEKNGKEIIKEPNCSSLSPEALNDKVISLLQKHGYL